MQTLMDILNDMTTKSKLDLRNMVDNLACTALQGLKTNMDFNDACYTILTSVLATISADGYFNTDEYYVAQPVIEAICGNGYTYDQTLQLIRDTGIDSDRVRDSVDYLIDNADQTTKSALFLICGAICAADKKLNDKELEWLNQLAG